MTYNEIVQIDMRQLSGSDKHNCCAPVFLHAKEQQLSELPEVQYQVEQLEDEKSDLAFSSKIISYVQSTNFIKTIGMLCVRSWPISNLKPLFNVRFGQIVFLSFTMFHPQKIQRNRVEKSPGDLRASGDLLDQLRSCQQDCDAAKRRGKDLEREMQQMKDGDGWGWPGWMGGNRGNMMGNEGKWWEMIGSHGNLWNFGGFIPQKNGSITLMPISAQKMCWGFWWYQDIPSRMMRMIGIWQQ